MSTSARQKIGTGYQPKAVTLNAHTYEGQQIGRNVAVRAGVGGASPKGVKLLS